MTQEIPFDVTVNGVETALFIRPPTASTTVEASKVYNRTFKEAINDGAILRGVLEKTLRSEGLWNDEDMKRAEELSKEISLLDRALNSGKENGKIMKVSRGREIAIDLRRKRFEIQQLLSVRNQYDETTAEAQADNAKFNYLVTACVYDYNTRKPYFESYQDYLDRAAEDLPFQIAAKFANYMYGIDENFEANLTENKFLRRFEFVNAEGHLIDKEGHLIDSIGRRVDEDGFLINNKGERIDSDGELLLGEDESVETAEFEDDLSGQKRKRRTKKPAE